MSDLANPNAILIVTDDEQLSSDFSMLFKKAGITGYALYAAQLKDAGKVSLEAHPSIVVFDTRRFSESLYPSIQSVASHCRSALITGAGHPQDVEQILEFVKLGIRDFIDVPLKETEIKALFNRYESLNSQSAIVHKNGKIVAVYGAKGGVGVTFLTANLAIALAKDKLKRVAVCDFSLEFADVVTYLNLEPKYSVRDVIENNRLLDISFLDGVMVEHPSGVKILPPPREDQDPVTSQHTAVLESTFSLLSKHYDYTLIDTGRLDPHLLQMVLTEANIILLLGNPDVPSLKGLVSLVRKLNLTHYDPEKIKVIINRFNSKNQVDVKEFEKLSRHPITLCLPNNFAVCIQAVNTGASVYSVNAKSDLAKKIDELADIIVKSGPSKKSGESIDPLEPPR